MGKVKHMAASRREQAQRTRARMLDAAYKLFCANGYEATTMQQVADEAEVAVQTVYLNFRTKSKLLSEVEGRLILGDQPSERWREQPWAKAIREETDPRRLLEIFVTADTAIKGRIGPFVAAVGPALPSDPETSAARERGRDEFFRTVLARLEQLGALRKSLTLERALDIVRVINSTEAYVDLTMRRGWAPREWSTWLLALLTRELLAERAAQPDGRSPREKLSG